MVRKLSVRELATINAFLNPRPNWQRFTYIVQYGAAMTIRSVKAVDNYEAYQLMLKLYPNTTIMECGVDLRETDGAEFEHLEG